MSKTKTRTYLKTIYAVITIVICIYALTRFNTRKEYSNAINFAKGWLFELPEGRFEDVDLDTFAFNTLQRGDTFTIENTIPALGDIAAPEVRIWMCHTAFDTYLDDELIYTYGKDKLANYEMINNGYHWIDIPKDSEGKTIRFEFYVNEPNALSNMERLIICDAKNSIGELISENILALCSGLFLILIGQCIIVMSIFLGGFSKDMRPLLYTGLYAIVIGLWTLTNKNLLQVISVNRDITMVCEYFCLYVGALPMLLFLYYLRRNDSNKLMTLPIKVMIAINFVMLAVTITLHVSGASHFPAAIPFYHLFDAIVVLYLVATCIYNYCVKRNEEEAYLLIGEMLLAVCFLYDIIIFNLAKYVNGVLGQFVGATSLGGTIFVFCMLFSFGNYAFKGITSKIENETLKKLAYADSLTGLYNRTKFNELAEELDSNPDQKYTLISFDLNELKTTNDTVGHCMGDKLLKSFANVLTESFKDDCIVCRIGGDEYSVIYYDNDRDTVADLLKAYNSRLTEENLATKEFTLSSAWGVAYSDEINERSFYEVNKLADKRMYEKKSEMKKQGMC